MGLAPARQSTTTAGQRTLRGLFLHLSVFRELRAEMPMQMAAVFLMVAMKPGIHQRDLPDLLNLSQSSVSRNINALGRTDRHGGKGLGLIEQRAGNLGWRTPELYLTDAGKGLVKRLMAI